MPGTSTVSMCSAAAKLRTNSWPTKARAVSLPPSPLPSSPPPGAAGGWNRRFTRSLYAAVAASCAACCAGSRRRKCASHSAESARTVGSAPSRSATLLAAQAM